MATFKKPATPPKPGVKPPVYSPSDTARTFDARPKASDDRRREERARPGQHVDEVVSDPLDAKSED